ncbi:hypothetical protein [Pseudomonas fluorescens]|uniref:Uncharacterized protein n=1 Tax=Pseudomonas fluorescens TaxID=294 RepID=A0A5E7VU87_PSEFL|nr:hypothetical protein [Pseudomonas fluorescens]VVQ26469.1 hypothetical protein PS928_06631 [Pseudomonas fluorescens]
MTKKPVRYGPNIQLDDDVVGIPLDKSEIEVRLAIANFVIRRVTGTPTGEEIFNGLIKRFENRYPHHKLLTQYLISPGYMDSDADAGDIY